jgi:galactofuranosylgalactofuranosylrhamnosyl-N-acetylglucosaminyl-diphospho-decaprenol beta-1,5/1,6-galactofuranosyltransferase
MKLFDILLPREGICSETSLFYKTISGEAVQEDDGLCFEEGAAVSFESFFNCFSANKYHKYTDTRHIDIELDFTGSFEIVVEAVTYGRRKVIASDTLSEGKTSISVDIEECFTPGYISFCLTALKKGKLLGGRYTRKEPPAKNIRIGIVICTFRREGYVKANLKRICEYADKEPILKDLHVFVIDNGNTLDSSIENERVTLIYNPNIGGSGGFSRGMLEVYERRGEGFTHMHLMDDDVVFFPETLAKTAAFLSVVKPENNDACMGAGMMRIDKPYHQHEFGAYWSGLRTYSYNGRYDLRRINSLLDNERIYDPEYSGWWYMTMPVHFVEKFGLSLPFFIKYDDVEYCIRACKNIVLLNGVGVWHEAFDIKSTSDLEYYHRRNELILASIYSPKQNAFSYFRKLIFETAKLLVCMKYNDLKLCYKGYGDFLKGADYFNSIDLEPLHKELRAHNDKLYTKKELLEMTGLEDIQFTDISKSPPCTLMKLTLNGYLIPRRLYRFCGYNKSGLRIADATKPKIRAFFCAEKVLIYNSITETGYFVTLNKKMLFKYGFKLAFTLIKLVFRYPAAAKTYRRNFNKLTSIENWKGKMKLS